MVFVLILVLQLLACAVGLLLDGPVGLGRADAGIGFLVMQGPASAGLLVAAARIERVNWWIAARFTRFSLFFWCIGMWTAATKIYGASWGWVAVGFAIVVTAVMISAVERHVPREPPPAPSPPPAPTPHPSRSASRPLPAPGPAEPMTNAQAQESMLHARCGECGHTGFDLETYSTFGWNLGRCPTCGHRREFTFPTFPSS